MKSEQAGCLIVVIVVVIVIVVAIFGSARDLCIARAAEMGYHGLEVRSYMWSCQVSIPNPETGEHEWKNLDTLPDKSGDTAAE